MAEDAGAADLLAGGRLQLGISRGSPEQVIDGWRYFGYQPAEGETDAEMARRHAEVFLELLEGEGFAEAESAADVPEPAGPAAHRAPFAGTARADLVGRSVTDDRGVGGRHRHESDELDAGLRRCERRPLPRHASAPHPRVPRGVAGGWARARLTRLCQPEHLCPRRATWTARTSASATTRVTTSATSTRTRGRSSAAPTPREPDVLIPQLAAGRGDRGRRHALADRAEPAGGRLQRARHRKRPEVRRARNSAGVDRAGEFETRVAAGSLTDRLTAALGGLIDLTHSDLSEGPGRASSGLDPRNGLVRDGSDGTRTRDLRRDRRRRGSRAQRPPRFDGSCSGRLRQQTRPA